MAVTAADVPSKYDLVYTVGANTYGHVFDRTRESTLYGSRARAEYGYTQTFLERTNVSGSYGDEAQAFFLTATQNDWSLGQGQSYFRGNDADSKRKYFLGSGIDVRTSGEIRVRSALKRMTGAKYVAVSDQGAGLTISGTAGIDATNLFTIDSSGTVTDLGAHGAGSSNQWGICNDGVNLYMAGATSIRKWNGTVFSTFSANANMRSLAFLNNALYSCDGSTLNTYDTAGTKTTLFTWKDASGVALAAGVRLAKITPYGGKLLIFFPTLYDGPELWIYDGISTSRVAQLPLSMIGYDVQVLNGVVFMSGGVTDIETYSSGAGSSLIPVVYYWANGSIGELWRSNSVGGIVPALNSLYLPALGTLAGRLLFTDMSDTALMEYNPASGAITKVGGGLPTPNGGNFHIGSCSSSVTVGSNINVTALAGEADTRFYPDTTRNTAATVTSSLIDFDNALVKQFRGVKVDWEGAGTVDISYQIDSLSTTSAYTSLQTSAVSGTEYQFPANTSGHGISIKLTINNGTATTKIKRLYVRGAPTLQSFRMRTYNLDLTSTPDNITLLNDGSTHPLTGHEQATGLISAITSTTPLTIVDRFGSYTGILEPDKSTVLEIHSDSGGGVPANSGQFIASVSAREV